MARRGARPPLNEPTLLEAAARRGHLAAPPAPLAERMRPRTLEEVLGPGHAAPRRAFATRGDRKGSRAVVDFVGATRFGQDLSSARDLAHHEDRVRGFQCGLGAACRSCARSSTPRANGRSYQGRGTTLFVDEIHRFNKSQQDAFLPHVENGTVTLIGATTENPSFSVNAAVLSRCRVFRLEGLEGAGHRSATGARLARLGARAG